MGASQSRPATTPINGEEATSIEYDGDAQANTDSAVTAAPLGERTTEGSFVGMSPDISSLIAMRDAGITKLMMEVSIGTRGLFKKARKNDIQLAYLRKLLRNEKAEIPELLRQYFYSNTDEETSASASATSTHDAMDLTPDTKKALENIKALLSAYQAYFEHFLAICTTWPTEGMEELGCLFAGVKEKEAALPTKLIQGTGLGVLQATAPYLNSYASMANENKFNWDELDRLAVQGLGGAQKAAGDSIVDLYFRGDSMTDEAVDGSRGDVDHDAVTDLGTTTYLHAHPLRGLSPVLEYALCAAGRGYPTNSLSLIKVLTAKLDLSLRHEVSADKNDQALPSL